MYAYECIHVHATCCGLVHLAAAAAPVDVDDDDVVAQAMHNGSASTPP